MRKIVVFITILSITLISCHYKSSKYNTCCFQNNQGFNEIMLIKGDTISWNKNKNMEGKYYHYHEGDTTITRFVFSGDGWMHGTVIDGHISDYVQNDSFLLADQKPLDGILGKYIHDSYGMLRREYDTVTTHDAKIKILEDSPVHMYWIIVKTTADIYGPLSYNDYINIKQQVGVPSTLMLKMEK